MTQRFLLCYEVAAPKSGAQLAEHSVQQAARPCMVKFKTQQAAEVQLNSDGCSELRCIQAWPVHAADPRLFACKYTALQTQ